MPRDRIIRACILLAVLACLGVDALMMGWARGWSAQGALQASSRTGGVR